LYISLEQENGEENRLLCNTHEELFMRWCRYQAQAAISAFSERMIMACGYGGMIVMFLFMFKMYRNVKDEGASALIITAALHLLNTACGFVLGAIVGSLFWLLSIIVFHVVIRPIIALHNAWEK
jgi:hypothetical protein